MYYTKMSQDTIQTKRLSVSSNHKDTEDINESRI